MAMKRWVKWLLAASAAAAVVGVAAIALLAWAVVEFTRPQVEQGAPMPELQLVSFEEQAAPVGLEQFRGQMVVLDFWSSG